MPRRSIDQSTPRFPVDPAKLGVEVLASATPETQSQQVRVQGLTPHAR